MKDWVGRLFKTIDKKDVDQFILFLTEDASFRFANMPAVVGRENIRKTTSQFFSSVNGLKHAIEKVVKSDDVVVCEGAVTYMLKDNSKATFPFANIFRMKNGLIADYRIYADISTLFQKA
ncbi:MAG: nuclear transport factor 2 family protein [Omnitrophica bacterium]|nr:nuclear transport factor 2 family protein [Candidatus Omnitrophota bacterium]